MKQVDIFTRIGELLTLGEFGPSPLKPTPLHKIELSTTAGVGEIFKEIEDFTMSILKNNEWDVQVALNARDLVFQLAQKHVHVDFDMDKFLVDFTNQTEQFFKENSVIDRKNQEIIQEFFEKRKNEIIEQWECFANSRKQRIKAEARLQEANQKPMRTLFGQFFGKK